MVTTIENALCYILEILLIIWVGKVIFSTIDAHRKK